MAQDFLAPPNQRLDQVDQRRGLARPGRAVQRGDLRRSQGVTHRAILGGVEVRVLERLGVDHLGPGVTEQHFAEESPTSTFSASRPAFSTSLKARAISLKLRSSNRASKTQLRCTAWSGKSSPSRTTSASNPRADRTMPGGTPFRPCCHPMSIEPQPPPRNAHPALRHRPRLPP